jgi:adenosylhomocysteine nucleosidase
MSAEDRVAVGATSAPAGLRVAIIVALGVEHASLQPHLPRRTGISLHQSGPGAARASAAARAALASGATALVSWGLAGGLTPELEPGTVLLPRELITQGGGSFRSDRVWHAKLTAELAGQFAFDDRSLLGATETLATPQRKAQAARASGAVAVDMESAAIAEVAERADARFVALRVIVDGHSDLLPPGAERWIDERGNRRMTAAIDAALTPTHWPALWVLAQRYRVARRVLDQLASRLLPNEFFLPPPAAST